MNSTYLLLLFSALFLWNPAAPVVQLPSLNSETHYDEGCYSYDYNDAVSDRFLSKYLICKNIHVQPDKPPVLLQVQREDVQYIGFENSSLPLIPKEIFENFTKLSILNLKNSNISVVNPQAFCDMTQLVELELQNNNIEEFFHGTFTSLANLKILDLSNNSLRSLKKDLFSNLTNLKVLKLFGNKLYFLERDCFYHLRSLETLDLTNSNILLDPFHTVFHIQSQNLKRVLASGNLFFKFPIIGNLTQLTFLDASYNRWSQLNLHQLSSLKFVNASHNCITTICTLTIIPIETFNMEELDLSYNAIKRIDDRAFQNLTHLQKLHLNNNFIKELSSRCFANLKNMTFLSLSFNNLEYLDSGYFTDLENLVTLRLDHNNLYVQSQEFLFPKLKSLRFLHIDNNLYNAIDASRIVVELPNLKMITLKNNNWYCTEITEALQIFGNNSITIAETQAEEPYIVNNACPEYVSDDLRETKLDLLFFKSTVLCIIIMIATVLLLIIRRQYYILRYVTSSRKIRIIKSKKPVIIRMLVPTSSVKNVIR